MTHDPPLTHFDAQGASRMVDVAAKAETIRVAVAAGSVTMQPETLAMILDKGAAKGDVLEVARIAGIMAAKRVDMLIPLCHQLALTSVTVDFVPDQAHSRVDITARVTCTGRTGVEMEALTAVAVTGLTIYDMCKSVDRAMVINAIRLLEKSGGRSGHFVRPNEASA
ncbi:MAG: cyclic pyranopterin monophosphate synthase MoaC [Magnetococcus sp. DMHC-1]|nr:cyclic pyranopterin monophosphate synthase MoaC [Magnetococcales bacterium]